MKHQIRIALVGRQLAERLGRDLGIRPVHKAGLRPVIRRQVAMTDAAYGEALIAKMEA